MELAQDTVGAIHATTLEQSSSEPDKDGKIITRMLALLCTICPSWVVARRLPDSAYARFMRRVERSCPFCRAYRRTHGRALGKRRVLQSPSCLVTRLKAFGYSESTDSVYGLRHRITACFSTSERRDNNET